MCLPDIKSRVMRPQFALLVILMLGSECSCDPPPATDVTITDASHTFVPRGRPENMELRFTAEEIRPLIEAVAAELLSRFPTSDNRLAYAESEAAALIGVASTTLRDERLRGRVGASLVGRKFRYTREDLLTYLASRRWSQT